MSKENIFMHTSEDIYYLFVRQGSICITDLFETLCRRVRLVWHCHFFKYDPYRVYGQSSDSLGHHFSTMFNKFPCRHDRKENKT